MQEIRHCYNPKYAILFDSVEVAVFISIFELHNDFISVSQEQIFEATGLKSKRQKVVRKILKQNNVLVEIRKIIKTGEGHKNIIHYRIDFGQLDRLFLLGEVKQRFSGQLNNFSVKKNDSKKQTPKLEVTKLEVAKSEKPKQEVSEEFSRWWQLYDKKVGKEESEKVWLKMSKKDKEKAMAHSIEFVRQREKKFRPDPKRYLIRKMFNDEIIGSSDNSKIKKNQDNDYQTELSSV